jgi:hypothetical protein
MNPSQNPGSRTASSAIVAMVPAASPTATGLASGSSRRWRSPQIAAINAIAGSIATLASTSMVLRPDSAKGKMSGDTDAARSSTRIIIIFFMKALQRGESRFLPSRRFLYWRDHVRQHVELLIKHAGRLVYARVVEGLEHHGGLVVTQVGLAVLALIDVHAQGQIKTCCGVVLEDLLAHGRIADQEQRPFQFQPGHLEHVPLIDGAHDHHAALADSHLEGVYGLFEGLIVGMLTRASCARADVAASPANRVVSNTALRAKASFFISFLPFVF